MDTFLEYFDFCPLSIDLHAYSEIFCNGTSVVSLQKISAKDRAHPKTKFILK